MVNHCSNPSCMKPLLYLSEGKIYVFDLPDPNAPQGTDGDTVRRLEHFWLCGPCSESFILEYTKSKVVHLAPKPVRVLAS